MIPENLYSATYSGVSVYELIHPRSSVMRRKKDGWVNATHILKVANFPKAKRTRILEKGVQTGVHEKVQGGYGKYQGTWVPLERAMAIAREFNVLDDLLPIFQYQADGTLTPPPAPKHHHATSGAAGRKKSTRLANGNGNSNSATSRTQGTTTTATRSSTRGRKPKVVTNATNKASKPEINSGPLSPIHFATPDLNFTNSRFNDRKSPLVDTHNSVKDGLVTTTSLKRLKVSNANESNRYIIRGTESSPVMAISDDEENNLHSQRSNINHDIISQLHTSQPEHHASQGSQKFIDDRSSVGDFMTDGDLDKALAESQTYGKGASALVRDNNLLARNSTRNTISPQSGYALSDRDKRLAKELFNYFETNDPKAIIPSFLKDEKEGFDINQPIDVDGNTPLHLACSMGDIRLCELLIRRGCDIRVQNVLGQIPFFSLVKYSNSYYRGDRNFEKFMGLLINTVFELDNEGHTLLHEIALSSSDKERKPAARYYTELLLRVIAEMNGITIDDLNSFINKQDNMGNTALHIFANNQADRCIRILLEYNAKIDILNNKNELVRDYINRTLNCMNLGVPFDASQTLDSLGNIKLDQNLLQSRELSFLNPYQQTLNKYGTYPTSVISPHRIGIYTSEAAMNVVDSSSEIIDKLGELAKAFENEVVAKDNDKKELGNIVGKVDEDLKKCKMDIKNILTSLLKNVIIVEPDEPVNQVTNDKTVKTDVEAADDVRNLLSDLETEFNLKSTMLKNIIEESQLETLKLYIKDEEKDEVNEREAILIDNKDNNNTEREKNFKLSVKLAELQLIRKQMIRSLVNIMAQGDETRERINNYRRLLATLSNIPISEIDQSLQIIEDSLRLDL